MRRAMFLVVATGALAIAPASLAVPKQGGGRKVSAQTSLAAAKAHTAASAQSTTQFLTAVAVDVDKFWASAFAGSGLNYVSPKVVIIPTGSSVTSRCEKKAVQSTLENAFFCGADQPVDIILPSDFLTAFYAKLGPVATAYVVAHEWGHDVQYQLGIFGLHLLTIQTETQADCFAGLWAHSALSRGLITSQAIQEVIAATDLVGDAPGTGRNNPQAHGRSGLRSAWFMNGFTSGKYSDCKTY